MNDIMTPIAPGELLDKLTILQIKIERISDVAKVSNVKVEFDALSKVAAANVPETDEINGLQSQLLEVNKQLWDIEDDIRDCERAKDFGQKFVELARAVYVTNDQRADLKKQINIALGSALIEEKSYADY